jgi:hypothetical protein
LVKWASCWDNYDDPYNIGKYTENPQQIDLDSKYTAAWFIGALVSPDSNGLVDESTPRTGITIAEEAKYDFNRKERDRLYRAKLTFTNPLNSTTMRVMRSQTAYGTGAYASAYRNTSVVRLLNQLKKDVVKLGRKFTVQTKNLPRVRTAFKNGLIKRLNYYIELEKIVAYEGVKVYASREDQNQGILRVDLKVQPTFPVLFIKVNMILQ